MNTGKYVFAQVLSFIDANDLKKNTTHTILNITDFELNTSQQNSLKSTVSRHFNTICQRTTI
jgi:hypothetical protein